MMKTTATALVVTLAALACSAQQTPVEHGGVKWERDLDHALERAKAAKHDVFLLFQEVPG